MKKPKDISRGIRLTEATWKRLNKLRDVHGSYDKALTCLLGVKYPNCLSRKWRTNER